MIVRIWRTQVDILRLAEYEHFEQMYSLPMFQVQAGCLGVLFLRTDHDCAALSFWQNRQAVEHLAESSTYQETVQQLQATGLLTGQQSVEVFEVKGGNLNIQEIELRLQANKG